MEDIELLNRIHKLEFGNQWAEAAKLWRRRGDAYSIEQAEACEMIVDANQKGDDFRRRVLEHAGPEPEVEGPKEDSIKWMAWFRKLEELSL